MIHALLRASISTTGLLLQRGRNILRHLLFITIAILLSSSVQVSSYQPQKVHAAPHIVQHRCGWYTIRNGDTLDAIAANVHVNVSTLALTNDITDIDLIFAGRSLCIPPTPGRFTHSPSNRQSERHTGILPNGTIRWYAYDALEGSDYQRAITLLRRAAAFYGLPAKLILALAWQESNFRQHVISPDGGIGIMQIMPGTAHWVNAVSGARHDPYKLADNIFMGAFYVRMLYNTFGWHLIPIISAYNAGGWTVTHRGIINWSYVNHVLATIRTLQ